MLGVVVQRTTNTPTKSKRLHRAEITNDIEIIESNLGFKIPTIYKLFLNNYKLGDGYVKKEKFLNPNTGWINPCASIIYKPFESKRELYFYGLLNLEELLHDWKVYGYASKEWSKFKLIRIGYLDTGGGLFLGTQDEMIDKIYRVVWDWGEDYELVANNVFEFARGLEIKEDFSNMDNLKYSDFYKSWGKEFWQVSSFSSEN